MTEQTTNQRQTRIPVLDHEVVEGLKELGGEEDPELFNDLVMTFVDDTPARVKAIEEAAAALDAEALMRAAHGLKSGAANMGAMRLSDLCRQLEFAGRGEDLEGVAERVAILRHEYEAACAALEASRT